MLLNFLALASYSFLVSSDVSRLMLLSRFFARHTFVDGVLDAGVHAMQAFISPSIGILFLMQLGVTQIFSYFVVKLLPVFA